jgi:hypothetical protein
MVKRAMLATKSTEAKKEPSISRTQKTGIHQSINSPFEQILSLQRSIGNQAVGRLLKSGTLQAKLRIGQPNDIYEKEADRVAEQVMKMPDISSSKYTRIQRKCPKCLKGLHGLLGVDKKEEEIQTKEIPGQTPEITSKIEDDLDSLKGGGHPLPESTREFFEPRLGADFGNVRVHEGGHAAGLAQALQAKAFTVGRDIVFGSGLYSPGTLDGKMLLAHELTHVLQQGGAGNVKYLQRTCNPVPIKARVGTPRACTDNFDNTFISGRVFKFRKNCDDLEAGQEAALIGFVSGLPTNATIEIHGYASVDGPLDFNQDLGCARALKAREVITTPNPGLMFAGITGSRISVTINHGPVPGPVADRRSAVIKTTTPPAPETITSQTVATSPGARTRTTIGVGEEVNLTHSPGSTAWTRTGGTLSAANGVTVILTAPDTAQNVTVRAGAATIVFHVIAPTSVNMDREPGTGVKHTLNQPDSGIQTRVFLGPDTVNFNRVRYRELDVAGVPTIPGVYSCNTFSTGHCAGAVGGACPDKALTSTVVAGKGTQSVLGDCAYSGHCGTAPPFVPGSITVNIPYEYKVGAGAFRRFRTVAQMHTLYAIASILTSSKAGATGITFVTSPTVRIPQCP